MADKPIRIRSGGEGKKKRDRTAERVKGQLPAPPLSAYNFFFRAERLAGSNGKRDEVEDGPSTEDADAEGSSHFKTMTKSIGRKWRELPATEKVPFEKLAKEDLGRYRRELAEYNEEVIRSTKIGRASLEGRMKRTPQSHFGAASNDDLKPAAEESRIRELRIPTQNSFPDYSARQFARLSQETNPQQVEPAALDFRGSLGAHMEMLNSLPRPHEPLFQQQIAQNVLLQHLLSGIAEQTPGSTFQQASASSTFSHLLIQHPTSNSIENNDLMEDSRRADLYERMIHLQNAQLGAQGNNGLWQQHQFQNPSFNLPYPWQLPTLAEILFSQINQDARTQVHAAPQFQPAMAQNVNPINQRDQPTILQQLSDAELSRAIASNPTLATQELLRQLEEEERRRQQR